MPVVGVQTLKELTGGDADISGDVIVKGADELIFDDLEELVF